MTDALLQLHALLNTVDGCVTTAAGNMLNEKSCMRISVTHNDPDLQRGGT